MIYRRLTVQNCARYASVVTAAVVGLCGFIFFSRLLPDIVVNALPFSLLWRLLLLTLIKYTPQMLLLSVFAGVLLTMRQFFLRHEMDAWFSAGIGLRHFIVPILYFALPAALFVGVFSLYVSPWSVNSINLARTAAAFDIDVLNLPRGRFGKVPGDSYIYFRDGDSDRLLVAGNKPDRDEIILASDIARINENTIQFIDGKAFNLLPPTTVAADGVVNKMEFDYLRLSLPAVAAVAASPRAKPPAALRWGDIHDRAELVWRINLPLAVVALALAALYLARANPRAGGRQNLLVAIALFFLYLNTLRYIKELMANNDLPTAAALLVPPLLIAVLLWLLPLGDRR